MRRSEWYETPVKVSPTIIAVREMQRLIDSGIRVHGQTKGVRNRNPDKNPGAVQDSANKSRGKRAGNIEHDSAPGVGA